MVKYKTRTPGEKEVLNLFSDLSDTILTDKTLNTKSQKDNILMSSKDENVNENENDKTLTSLKDKNEKQNNYKNASKKKR